MAFIPFWFILITVLWTGFFVLEGFDLGVGMLHAIIGRDEPGKRTVINTIGPLWDGNEVWLIVAAAAIFAAFPLWYATMFSGFYLAFVLLLAALIFRGVSFEYRNKIPTAGWRSTWTWLLMISSVLVPLLIGITLGDLLHGLPINSSHNYTGGFWDLFQPYGIMMGIALTVLCVLHGATFIAIKTIGIVHDRAERLAKRVAVVTVLVVLAFIAWTHVQASRGAFLGPIELLAAIAVIAAGILAFDRHDGWAFTATTCTFAFCIVALFVDLYPRVMVSSTNPAFSLTAHNAASPPYTLKVMTVIALVLLPFVLAYQAWTYYVFRRRMSDRDFRPAPPAQPRSFSAVGPSPAPAHRSGGRVARGWRHGRS